MAKKQKGTPKPKARLPRGFVDRLGADIRAQNRMLDAIAAVYERYGFEPIETPLFEYTDALGKFLPDQDRPNEGVFSVADDDEQWMSLRYDMTAPLARHVAQNWQDLVLPYRTWRAGPVFRNEKPGPGRFRQFMQCDADTIGAPGVQADAEMCMMMADVLEAVGVKRGDYVIRVNNRKVLDGVMEAIGLGGEENAERRLGVLRSIDKGDRIGGEGVRRLLGEGRIDESGSFTVGVGLDNQQIGHLSNFLLENAFNPIKVIDPRTFDPNYVVTERDVLDEDDTLEDAIDRRKTLIELHTSWWNEGLRALGEGEGLFPALRNMKFSVNSRFRAGIDEIEGVFHQYRSCGYDSKRVRVDLTTVRGLEYYTGMVYEAELTFPVVNERGEEVVFGSVGGGGRYDGLVSRFRGEAVPACGFSIGVSRLQTALRNLGKLEDAAPPPLVVVCVMDKNDVGSAQALTAKLREAAARQEALREGGADEPAFRCEMYQGNPKNFGKQLQYADRRNAAIAVFQGTDEKAAVGEDGTPKPTVQIKDLIEGRREAEAIESNEEWRAARPGQRAVSEDDLIAEVLATLRAQRDG